MTKVDLFLDLAAALGLFLLVNFVFVYWTGYLSYHWAAILALALNAFGVLLSLTAALYFYQEQWDL